MLRAAIFSLAVAFVVGEECPSLCTMDYNPVCGSDGQTYGNLCSLEAEACQIRTSAAGKVLTLAYDGKCAEEVNDIVQEESETLYEELIKHEAVEDKTSNLKFQPKEHHEPEEVFIHGADCSKPCTRIYDPVCGDDGVDYPNECEMENAKCRFNRDVKVAHKGLC